MTWLNPAAWLGLLAIVVPVLVHLLGRAHPARMEFPAIRFIGPTRQAPVRRARPSDLLLLAIRAAVIATAVTALARPHRPAASGTGQARVARAILVDTSASMTRSVTAGEPAVLAARREAARLAGEADAAIVVETGAPGDLVAGAVSWLSRHAGRRELVVVSDFQAGTIDSAALAVVGEGVGVGLHRVPQVPEPAPVSGEAWSGGRSLRIDARLQGSAVTARWSPAGTDRVEPFPVVLRAPPGDRPSADAARDAARRTARFVPAAGDRPVFVVAREDPGRAAVLAAATLPSRPWQGRFLVDLIDDAVLRDVAAGAEPDSVPPGPAPLVTVARSGSGDPVILAGASVVDGKDVLLLFPLADAGSVTMAALLAAAGRAAGASPAFAEAVPAFLPDEVLRRWERAPATAAGPPRGDDNPARWLWLAALGLLGVEALVRRLAAGAQRATDRPGEGRRAVA